MTNRGPWPKHEDKGGHTFITIKGIRWKIEGTGHSFTQCQKAIKAGKATEVSE